MRFKGPCRSAEKARPLRQTPSGAITTATSPRDPLCLSRRALSAERRPSSVLRVGAQAAYLLMSSILPLFFTW